MKKLLSFLFSLIILVSSSIHYVPAAVAVEKSYTNYTSTQIMNMYPDAYEAMVKGIKIFSNEIDISEYELNEAVFNKLYEAILQTRPEIFYISPLLTDYSTSVTSGNVRVFRPIYNFAVSEIPKEIQKFDAAVEWYLKDIDDSWTTFEKCRYIHDILATTVEYDTDYLNYRPDIYTAYGALINNVAVCQGYTLGYNYLAERLGVDAYFIASSNIEHSWSMVKIGKNYYHVDVTWDDPAIDFLGVCMHEYCLISDEKVKNLRPNMEWSSEFEATSTKFDNVWWNGVRSAIYIVDTKEYYLDNKHGFNSGAFKYYDKSLDKHVTLAEITDKWHVEKGENQYWSGNHSRLAYDGERFYYSTNNAVYSIKPNGKGKKPYFQSTNTQEYNIFGLATLSDGRLYVEYNQDPMTDGMVECINLENGEFEIGDINNDGQIDIKDATMLQKYLINQVFISSKQISLANFNSDDSVDIRDVTAIQKMLCGL